MQRGRTILNGTPSLATNQCLKCENPRKQTSIGRRGKRLQQKLPTSEADVLEITISAFVNILGQTFFLRLPKRCGLLRHHL
ncbi:unnamed protein product, partial [Nesidiocoris tenuis]